MSSLYDKASAAGYAEQQGIQQPSLAECIRRLGDVLDQANSIFLAVVGVEDALRGQQPSDPEPDGANAKADGQIGSLTMSIIWLAGRQSRTLDAVMRIRNALGIDPTTDQARQQEKIYAEATADARARAYGG